MVSNAWGRNELFFHAVTPWTWRLSQQPQPLKVNEVKAPANTCPPWSAHRLEQIRREMWKTLNYQSTTWLRRWQITAEQKTLSKKKKRKKEGNAKRSFQPESVENFNRAVLLISTTALLGFWYTTEVFHVLLFLEFRVIRGLSCPAKNVPTTEPYGPFWTSEFVIVIKWARGDLYQGSLQGKLTILILRSNYLINRLVIELCSCGSITDGWMERYRVDLLDHLSQVYPRIS